jgi:acyl carrier protein
MTNHEKLKQLLIDVFLLDASEYHLDLQRAEIETWDSLGTVSLAVGIKETFEYHFTPDEANGIQSIQQIVDILKSKGISFDE